MDDQHIAEIRDGDGGRSAWSTNWDGDLKQPKYMFNPAVTGYAALQWDDVLNGTLDQDSLYYIDADTMIDFDPIHEWQEGDTIPRRTLRTPEASRADIKSESRWQDGHYVTRYGHGQPTR